MSEEQKNKWDKKEIGALWLKKTPKGVSFLSGSVDGKKVSIWKNNFYEEGGDKPYYRIYEDTFKTDSAPQRKEQESQDIPF